MWLGGHLEKKWVPHGLNQRDPLWPLECMEPNATPGAIFRGVLRTYHSANLKNISRQYVGSLVNPEMLRP